MNKIIASLFLALAAISCSQQENEPVAKAAADRVDHPALAISDMQQADFLLESDSDLLANPTDDHSKGVFDPEVKGKTDRFILKFRKPT